MLTFQEFLNRRDNAARQPFPINQQKMGSMQVSQVFQDYLPTPSLTPSKPTPKSTGMVKPLGGRSAADKPMPTKPADFLGRKGSSFRKGF